MAMKTINVAEATELQLNWLVAKCEGRRVEFNYQYTEEIKFDGWWQLGPNHWQPLNQYSTDWAQGGPIIERENICLRGVQGGFHAWYHQTPPKMFGPTMLIAAMRCYVASKLGDTAEVPEELT